MNTLLTIFHIAPSTHIKALSKVLFSFFLVASFLASCTTDNPITDTDTSTLTLTDCPADQSDIIPDTAFEWVNPTGDINITSIVITTIGNTVNAALPVLTPDSTSATLPEGTYAITITAVSTLDAEATATCSFVITVIPDDRGTFTLTDCPADQSDIIPDTAFEWVNPTGDINITSIVITPTGNTVNAALPVLTPDSTSATLPEGTYAVTTTAASTSDATTTATCSFAVTVVPLPLEAICPEESILLSLNLAGDPIILSNESSISITPANNNGPVTFSYDPATITEDDISISPVTVTVTATDSAAQPNTATCTFTVDVTQDMGSATLTDTIITCGTATPAMATLDPDGTRIVIANVITTGITATNGGSPVADADITFKYTPATLTATGTHTITVTAKDDTGEAALDGDAEATCTFEFTVHPAPDPTLTCPAGARNSGSIAIGRPVTWTAPTLAGAATGSSVRITPAITPAGATETSLTRATFPTATTYTVIYTAITSGDTPIMVGGENLIPLTCTFDVTVPEPSFDCPSDAFQANQITIGRPVTWRNPTVPAILNAPLGTSVRNTPVITPEGATNANLTTATFLIAGNYMVTYTAIYTSDDTPIMVGGNELTCTFSVTVREPTLTCPTAPRNIATVAVDRPVTWNSPNLNRAPPGASVSDTPTITPAEGVTAISLTSATFPATDTYTITYTATNSDGTPIMINERSDNPTPLTCSFTVFVPIPSPAESLFALEIELDPPGPNNPFLIQTVTDLARLATVVNGGTTNINVDGTDGTTVTVTFSNEFDINQSGSSNYSQANYRLMNDISFNPNNRNNFTPIGMGGTVSTTAPRTVQCGDKCFRGTFDGNSNTISGLRFNDRGTERSSTNIGLFGTISNASISNLILTGINITGRSNVGGLVGVMLSGSKISNVFAAGSITGSRHTGGLIGYMSNATITNTSSAVATTSDSFSVGGLIGRMEVSRITNAFASGDVVGGTGTVGGLVGDLEGNRHTNSQIINAYASGAVSATANNRFRVGGLVGSISRGVLLRNTLAWGAVSGSSVLGGLVGFVTTGSGNGAFSVTNSYWDTDETGQPTSARLAANSPFFDAAHYVNYVGYTTNALHVMPGGEATPDIYVEWNTTPALDIDGSPGTDTPWTFSDTDYPRLNGLIITPECQREPTASCLNYNP